VTASQPGQQFNSDTQGRSTACKLIPSQYFEPARVKPIKLAVG